jgi:hypothetical protein
MTKKALIENITTVHTYNDGSTGLRVAEVVNPGDEFASTFDWVDCPDEVVGDQWCYVESSNTFKKTIGYYPPLDQNNQPFDLTTDNENEYVYNWEAEHWDSVI